MKNMIGPGIVGPQGNGFQEDDLVCHCFQYTRRQIEKEYTDNGRSLILDKIIREKKTGGCDCVQRNPKGR
jgi:hypothetical protein